MNKQLLSYICCPTCNEPLTLHVEVETESGQVTKGTASCASCSTDYAIDDGIIDLGPQSQADVRDRELIDETEEERRFSNAFFGADHFVRKHWGYVYTTDRRELLYSRFINFLYDRYQGSEPQLFLDLGGADGWAVRRLARRLPNSHFICVDISINALRCGLSRAGESSVQNVDFILADLNFTPIRRGSADVIFVFGVIHHFTEHLERVRSLLSRLLKGKESEVIILEGFTVSYPKSIGFKLLHSVPLRLLAAAIKAGVWARLLIRSDASEEVSHGDRKGVESQIARQEFIEMINKDFSVVHIGYWNYFTTVLLDLLVTVRNAYLMELMIKTLVPLATAMDSVFLRSPLRKYSHMFSLTLREK